MLDIGPRSRYNPSRGLGFYGKDGISGEVMLRKSLAIVAAVVATVSALASGALFFYHHTARVDALVILGNEAAHVFLFAALAWAAYFVGSLVYRSVFRQKRPYWEIQLALGFIIFGLAAFALGAAHLLYAWVVRGIILVILALSAPLLWRYGNEFGGLLKERLSKLTPGPLLVAAALAPLVAAILVRVGLPPFEWDSLVYHLYIPKVYAEAHAFVYLPRLAYSSIPLGGEMMFTWGYLWDGIGCAAAVAPLLNALMVVATWRLARRYMDNLWATAAAAFLFVTPSFLLYFPSAYVDMILGAFALMSLFIYVRGFKSYGDAALAGVFLGAALGIKYTGSYALIGFAPIVITDLIRRRVPVRRALAFLAVAFVVVLPWLGKAFVERGNPVFPSLYKVFGGRDLSPVVAEKVLEWQRSIGMGRELEDYAFLPYRVSFEANSGYENFDGFILPVSVVALLLSLIWFRRWRLITYTAFYFVAWAFIASQQLRFLSASFGLFAILAAGVFAYATARFKGVVRGALAFVLIGSVVTFGYAASGPSVCYFVPDAVKYIMSRNADGYLLQTVPVYRGDKFANENLPEDAVILMIFNDHLLYLEREAVYDSFFEASETLTHVETLGSPSEVADYVEGLGATHILTGQFSISYFWSHYDPATVVLWYAYLKGYTDVIYDDGEIEIRVIKERGRNSQ